MNESEAERNLEHLEHLSHEVEATATAVAVKAKAFGGEVGARVRLAQVKMRLRVALDELETYPHRADDIGDITDE
jgi:hypothetical protein